MPNASDTVDPGMYTPSKKFGSDVKTMKIGVKRLEKPILMTVGPGAYNPSKADDFTRPKSPTTKMSKAASRPKSFANPSQENIGPGAYSNGKKFGEGIKTFKIGEKREEKIGGGVGPG